ncbi:MAG: helix-turn-helix domain-containing protein [Bryobacteraceae bacterium]
MPNHVLALLYLTAALKVSTCCLSPKPEAILIHRLTDRPQMKVSHDRYEVLQGKLLDLFFAFFSAIPVFFRSRAAIALEVVALRQQVAVLKRKQPRPILNSCDLLFWITLRRFWPGWKSVLLIVKPDTVVAWHRTGFRWYWRWRSCRRPGRPKITPEVRDLIRRLAQENPGWGAPKIHGELQKLGFEISERTISGYLQRVHRRGDPGKSWLTFLHNHCEVIVALDFFTVPTIAFQQAVLPFRNRARPPRKILHFNVTRYPRRIGSFSNCARPSRKLDPIVTSCWIATRSSTRR